jgi:hypothetical protein
VTTRRGAVLDASGDLDSAVEADRLWMTCTCGATMVRMLEPAVRVPLLDFPAAI